MVGEFKDDRIQHMQGRFSFGGESGTSYGIGPVYAEGVFRKGSDYCSKYYVTQIQAAGGALCYFDTSYYARDGATTRTKQKGVKYIVKVL